MKINKTQLRIVLQAILAENCDTIDEILCNASLILCDLLADKPGFREKLEKMIMAECINDNEKLEIEW